MPGTFLRRSPMIIRRASPRASGSVVAESVARAALALGGTRHTGSDVGFSLDDMDIDLDFDMDMDIDVDMDMDLDLDFDVDFDVDMDFDFDVEGGDVTPRTMLIRA